MSSIAKNIKRYRAKLGISQDKLSKLAGILYIQLQKLSLGLHQTLELKTSKKSLML